MANGFRIERNGWSEDGEPAAPAPAAPARPSLAATIGAMATASGRATTIEGLCISILEPLRADGRTRAAWMGVTFSNATVVFEASGFSHHGEAVGRAAQSLERAAEGEVKALSPDVAAALPGVKGSEVARGVALPPADPWRGWVLAVGSGTGDDARDVETLLAAAGGFGGLALARIAALDRSRVAEARLAPPADAAPGAPHAPSPTLAMTSIEPTEEPVPAAANGNGAQGHSANGNGHGGGSAAKNGARAGTRAAGAPGGKALLSAAALDGIRSFVEVTPGVKSPKLADGPSVHVGMAARDASRWIARLLVAASEGLRTLRVAVEADRPVVRIESDGPLSARANVAVASIGDEMSARGGGLKVEDAGTRARLLATFPKA